MRTAFVDALVDVAAADPRVWLITGDLGFSVLEKFADRFPDRFLNAGVAEQNMVGVAAGLALAGHVVFVYSIVNFPVMRCLEQVRNDVCYHRLPVKIVSVGGGMVYGSHGYSHHGTEDIAIMRAVPHMKIAAPNDPREAAALTRAVAADPGPCYLRLGKGGEPVVHDSALSLRLGEAVRVQAGNRVTVLAAASALTLAMTAVEDFDADLWSVPTIRPLDPAVFASVRRTGRAVTVECHGPGGLGTAVAEWVAESDSAIRFRAVRFRPEPVECAGSERFLREAAGVSAERITAAVEGVLRHE